MEVPYTVKKVNVFPWMSPTKPSLAGNKKNYFRPGRVWLVTSRLGMEKKYNLFYTLFAPGVRESEQASALHVILIW